MCFLFQPSGQLLLVCCTVFHIKNSYAKAWLPPRRHVREQTHRAKQTTVPETLRKAQHTTAKGDSELKSPREGKLFSMTFKHSFVCCKPHCNWTSHCPFTRALVPDCWQPEHGCAIRCSGVTTAFSRICNERGREAENSLVFFHRNALFSAYYKKRAKPLL